MKSPFDDIFANVAATHHSIFGAVATYVVKATDDEVEIAFMIDKLQMLDTQRSASRSDVWVLTGTILSSKVARPAKGDRLTLEGDPDQRTYILTQTPLVADDGNQWYCEFQSETPTTRGGNNVFPLV